jgi:dynein light intermediate chain 1
LGCYQLGLSSPEFLPLLKFAIRSQTVADSCVVILLDWSRPWKFLVTLRSWIHVLRYVTDEICKENTTNQWSQGKAVMDELKENCKLYKKVFFYLHVFA